jgi:hypothetical protein
MFDDVERLRAEPRLYQLLAHYAEAGADDGEAWQLRVMALEGTEPKALARLHGELIAWGWVEQNTGAAGGCYRATGAGVRALNVARTPGEPLAA